MENFQIRGNVIKEPSPKGSMAGKQSPRTIFYLGSVMHKCRNGVSTTCTKCHGLSPVPFVQGLCQKEHSKISGNGFFKEMGKLHFFHCFSHLFHSHHLSNSSFQVLAGSYFSVAGAFLGLLKYGRVSLFGMLIIIWGLVKEVILRKPANTSPLKSVYMYPAMSIAVVCAFSSIRRDVRRLMRSCRARRAAKPPWSSSKSKRK
ncbi:hypothetical protein PVL29_011606 [Vitis rotundifolia]|uniref:Uncharacterized protein n=1 Tax=Vitis rotundifolia TaxID=103349 RepID=A0AA39DSI7_VITRO|nr:hypothetical protein PVL29_011606 [Vitis rotundifolia]